jgi:GNAT superfamily N-acetyltransferase
MVTNADAELTSAYLRWKYERNPYVSDPLIFLALYNDRVVAMRGAYGSCWHAGEPATSHLMPSFGDLVISEEHRNRGLFARLMEGALEDLRRRRFAHACSLSPGRVTILGSLATGWKAVGPVEPMAARRGTGTLRRWVKRHPPLVTAHAKATAYLRRIPGLRTPRRATADQGPFAVLDARASQAARYGDVVLDASPRPREMAQLAARHADRGRLAHDRSETYFTWRFRDPRFRYRFLYAGSAELDGYLVLGALGRRWSRDCRMLDWQGRTPAVKEQLLTTALALGAFHKVSVWSASLDESARSILRRLHFEPDEQVAWSSSVLVRPVGAVDESAWMLDGRDLRRADTWELSMLPSDAF